MSEKFSLKWNDYQQNITKTLSNLRLAEDFFDVTLVCDDNRQLSAHKVVLSSCSEYFRNILQKNKHPHLLLCLENVSLEEIGQIMDYIYLGEVSLYQEEVNRFVEVGQRFKIEGLVGTLANDEPDYKENKDESEAYEADRSVKTFSDSQLVVNSVDIEEGSSIDEIDKQINNLLSENSEGIFSCNMCGKVGDKFISHMKNHIETHLDGIIFPCHICGKQLKSRNSLSFHKSKYHRNKGNNN